MLLWVCVAGRDEMRCEMMGGDGSRLGKAKRIAIGYI
jgi:hypothetical protein